MRVTTGLAVGGVLAACAVGASGFEKVFFGAAPPAAPLVADAPADPAVAPLVADLGSADYRVREKAGKLLEEKAERVLPDLRRALAATDNPEVSRRLSALIRKMDYDRLVSPKRVTLSAKDKTAKDVFADIARQTGYRIDYQPNGGREGKFSFEFADTPFWQAVDKVAEAAGAGYTNYDEEAVQINSYSDAHNPYVAYAGPFRLVANGINSNKNVQLSGLPRRGQPSRSFEHIGLNFQVQAEPKNPILGALQAELVSATDETGASLVPPRDQDNRYGYSRSYYSGGYRGHNTSGSLNLVRAGKDATTIKSLKGKIGIHLLAGTSPEVTVADPLKVKNKKLVGRTVEVDYDATTEANGNYSVALTIRKRVADDPNNVDYNWGNSIWQKVELTDAKGNRYRCYGPNTANNNGNSIQLTLPFGPDNRFGVAKPAVKLGPPVKLVVNEWHQVTHEVSFEFKDIPLP